MGCPGCGSSLWDREKCPACGRLASDTSRRVGAPPEPREAAREAVWKGALGGALAGYLGGGPLELDKLGNAMLVAAGLGAAIGIAVAAWLSLSSGLRDWVFWLFVPAISAGTALLVGFGEAFNWALGWAVAQRARGLAAAVCGALVGGAWSTTVAYIAARRRGRADVTGRKRNEDLLHGAS